MQVGERIDVNQNMAKTKWNRNEKQQQQQQ